jgi:hypothetical protein
MIPVLFLYMVSVRRTFGIFFVFCIPCESQEVKNLQYNLILSSSGNGTATTHEGWVGALISQLWDLKEVCLDFFAKLYTIKISYQVRKASVRVLSDLITSRDVVGNILLARKYRAKPRLRDGYLKLIKQTGPVKIDQLSLNLDLLTLARILFEEYDTGQLLLWWLE